MVNLNLLDVTQRSIMPGLCHELTLNRRQQLVVEMPVARSFISRDVNHLLTVSVDIALEIRECLTDGISQLLFGQSIEGKLMLPDEAHKDAIKINRFAHLMLLVVREG